MIVRLLQRGISTRDVEKALVNGEIIEEYPADYPYPSCLILGITFKKRFVHIVCGISEEEVWIITAYYPNIMEWKEDLKTRREKP